MNSKGAVADADERLAHTLDLRVREAFFAESRNIGRPKVLLDLVRDVGGDVARVECALQGDTVRAQTCLGAGCYEATRERDELIGRPLHTDIPIVVNEAAIIEFYAR